MKKGLIYFGLAKKKIKLPGNFIEIYHNYQKTSKGIELAKIKFYKTNNCYGFREKVQIKQITI